MPTILIVDDDPLDREIAIRLLSSIDDLEIQQASDGEEALDYLAAHSPDLVLTDLRMPRMDGLDLVKTASEDHPAIPFILMTSKGSEKIAVAALQAGASGYVSKHELDTELEDTIRRALDISAHRKSAREVARYIDQCETRFTMANHLRLIPPLVGFLQENLSRVNFSTGPIRAQIGMALAEAISNAMVHGNLEVSSELRRNNLADYETVIREHSQQSPWADRRIRLTALETPERVKYVITDEGPGFDTTEGPDPTAAENLLKPSGRGLFLIRMFMDSVTFNEKGNEIRLEKGAEG